jgi:hypothetical protein
MSGSVTDRPALRDAREFARSGNTLIVWKLDRLARAVKQLIEAIENLRIRCIGFRSLTEALDTRTAQGRPVFPDIPQMLGPLGVILCPPRRGGKTNSIGYSECDVAATADDLRADPDQLLAQAGQRPRRRRLASPASA